MPCSTLKVTTTQLQHIATQWQQIWQQTPEQIPTLSPEWYAVWQQQFKTENSNIWTVADENDNTILIAPLTINQNEATFAYTNDLIDYNDFIAPNGCSNSNTIGTLIEQLIQTAQITKLTLKSIPDTSNTANILKQVADSNGWHIQISTEDPSPYKTLPNSWDEYLLSLRRKDRHELKRKLKRINNSGDLNFIQLTDQAQIENSMDQFFRLHRSSSTAKREYMNIDREQFFRRIAPHLAQHGMTKLNFLELNGTKIATSLSFITNATNYLYNSGYNPEYAHLSAGLINHALNIQSSIKEGIKTFDFMRGDERYKYHLGAVNRYTLIIQIDIQR